MDSVVWTRSAVLALLIQLESLIMSTRQNWDDPEPSDPYAEAARTCSEIDQRLAEAQACLDRVNTLLKRTGWNLWLSRILLCVLIPFSFASLIYSLLSK